MARLGRILRVTGNLYRDLDTGRFISWTDVQPILEQARQYGYLGAAARGRYRHAAETLELRYDIPVKESQRMIADWLGEKRKWLEEGEIGDEPKFPSP